MEQEPQNLLEADVADLMPKSYKEYQIDYKNPMLSQDEEVLEKLFEAGFNNKQAQLVYDLANERVIPYISDLASEFESQKQMEKLIKHFGSEEKFREISSQISRWAKQEFAPEVYDALGSTSEGVIALYKMMASQEPSINKENNASEMLNEEALTKMMQDPKYWQTKDKDYIAKITKGFERLYDK